MPHHSSDHREAFRSAVEAGTIDAVLIGQLWNCTDIMPASLCAELDMPAGATYAQGARRLKSAGVSWIEVVDADG